MLLQLLLDDLAAGPVFLVLEGVPQGRQKLGQQLLHVAPQGGAAPGRQVEEARHARVPEVRHVAGVARPRLAGRLGLQHPADDGVLADALGPERIDIVAQPDGWRERSAARPAPAPGR